MTAVAPEKPLKKTKPEKPVKVEETRPVRITIEVLFEQGSRKVTPADLEHATEAAASAFRTSLEARTPRYRIGRLTATVEYGYLLVRRTLHR